MRADSTMHLWDFIRRENMQNVEKKTLQNRLHAAEQEIASVRKQLDELDAPKVVQGRYVSEPKTGTEYYVVANAVVGTWVWCDDLGDHGYLAQGETFSNKESAEKELSRRQAMQALRCCEGARGFVMGKDNYYLYWDPDDGMWFYAFTRCVKHVSDSIYFDTREQAMSAINSLTPEQQEALK